jgi:hypothetical protein
VGGSGQTVIKSFLDVPVSDRGACHCAGTVAGAISEGRRLARNLNAGPEPPIRSELHGELIGGGPVVRAGTDRWDAFDALAGVAGAEN